MDLVVVSGYTGSGKSTLATAIADSIGATVASFDWLMSALRSVPDVWAVSELPVERQRAVGWSLLGRVAEQQLRRGASCVLDLVARDEAVDAWRELAHRYGARFTVVECRCSDADLHRTRVAGRTRDIPGWYELSADDVARSRARYVPLADGAKVAVDAVDPLADNLARVLAALDRGPERNGVARWVVVRQDVHGSRFDVKGFATEADATAMVDGFESGYPHHQTYFVERRAPSES